MVDQDTLEVLQEINKNLKLLLLANREDIEKERQEFLDSGNNKKIFNLCNGKRQIKDIAKKIGITTRAVQYVIDQLTAYGFVTLIKGESGKAKYPKK